MWGLLSWLPTYLHDARGLGSESAELGALAAAPYAIQVNTYSGHPNRTRRMPFAFGICMHTFYALRFHRFDESKIIVNAIAVKVGRGLTFKFVRSSDDARVLFFAGHAHHSLQVHELSAAQPSLFILCPLVLEAFCRGLLQIFTRPPLYLRYRC